MERIDVAGLTIAFERTGQETQAGDRAFYCVTRNTVTVSDESVTGIELSSAP